MRILIYLVLVLILLSLGSALVYLVRDRGEGERAIRALTCRIGLSLGLFILLMAGHYLGVIAPAVS